MIEILIKVSPYRILVLSARSVGFAWRLEFGVWRLAFEKKVSARGLAYGVSRMKYGVWCMAFEKYLLTC